MTDTPDKKHSQQNLLTAIVELGKEQGFELDKTQIHTSGERTLLSPQKLVLTGVILATGKKIIIKCSNLPLGIEEIEREKKVREKISHIKFAESSLTAPREIFFQKKNGTIVSITEFIEQDRVFVAYPITDQFFMALNAFEDQEGFHATTHEHLKEIVKTFPVMRARDYCAQFQIAIDTLARTDTYDARTKHILDAALAELVKNQTVLDRFGGYLTHSDFVPHNFRIHNRRLYVLDFVAIFFGNKYEGWARFINYMTIHNPELARLLLTYLTDTRSKEECQSLLLMRLYKIGILLEYYARVIQKTDGDLKALTRLRIWFWVESLDAILKGSELPATVREQYIEKRNALRSEEEKRRQREFSQA